MGFTNLTKYFETCCKFCDHVSLPVHKCFALHCYLAVCHKTHLVTVSLVGYLWIISHKYIGAGTESLGAFRV